MKTTAFTTLEALCPANVLVVRNTYQYDLLKQADCLKVETSSTDLEGVKRLLRGRSDYFAAIYSGTLAHLATLPGGVGQDIVALEPAMKVDPVYTAFSKKTPHYQQLVADYDRGIQQLKDTGDYEKILKRHHLPMKAQN